MAHVVCSGDYKSRWANVKHGAFGIWYDMERLIISVIVFYNVQIDDLVQETVQ